MHGAPLTDNGGSTGGSIADACKKSADRPCGQPADFYNAKIYYNQTTPCASIASATFTKPAMFAPATRLSFMPYFSAALAALW